ncbi:MAG TPA: zinc ribbon domain-containing protein [bacterium]|nr:zinc ribbon domain-containing protein [bacterium]
MPEEKCPNCGTPYESDATFCINCGAKREEAAESEPPAPSEAATPAEPGPKDEPPIEEPPPRDEPPDVKTPPPAESASDKGVLERPDDETEKTAPGEPKKKSKKGCCIAAVFVGVIFLLAVACVLGLHFTGMLEEWGLALDGEGVTHDFAAVTEDDFTVWQKGEGAVVKPEKEMLKVRNALVGLNYDPGTNYSASCTVFVQNVENDEGWAGLVMRVNPKGGDRYAFAVLPKKKLARINKIAGKTKPLVLASARVAALRVGMPYTVKAAVSGNELTMELNGTVVGEATDIGLLEGPMGFEVRGATAYFDDLSVRPE